MTEKTIFVGIGVVFIYTVAFVAWKNQNTLGTWVGVRLGSQGLSKFLLFAWLALSTIVLEQRGLDQLLVEGFSLQNIIKVVVVSIMSIWSCWLLLSRKVVVRKLFSATRVWTSTLIFLFLLSSVWSVWPEFTLFRAGELASVWILSIHIFMVRDPKSSFHQLFFVYIGLSLLNALLNIEGTISLGDDLLFGALRSNVGGTMAGAYFLFLLTEKITKQRVAKWLWTIPLIALLLFGSLSAVISLVLAFPIMLLFSVGRLPRLILLFLFTISFVAALIFVPSSLGDIKTLETLATTFGKQTEHVVTLTGRIPLWLAVWDETSDKPFGLGYSASDRVFALTGFTESRGGWTASSAHSGYISSWMGTGWFGLFGVVVVFVSTLYYGRFIPKQFKPFYYSYVVLLAINNLTIVGVGGYVNPAWLVLMALSCYPTLEYYEHYIGTQPLSKTGR